MAAERPVPIGFGDARVRAATLGAAALVAQQVVGKALRDTLFLASFGIAWLPYAMIGASVLSAALVLALSRAAGARSPRRVARGALLASAALFLAAWAASAVSPRAAAVITYLHSGALSAASASVFWTLVSDTFDPYAARVSVPRIMAGATLGGVLGGLVTWRAAAMLHAHDLLPLGAALNLLCLATVPRLGRRIAGVPRLATEAGGWRTLVHELPYLRALALLVVAGALTQATLDYLLSSAAVSSLGRGPRLLSFFALFQTAVGVLSFVLQVAVSRSALERFGVGAVLRVSPTLLLAGVVGSLVAPPLLAIVLLRGGDGVLGASLHRSAYEVLFAPLEPQQRRAAKPLLDVGFDRLGMLLGSALVASVVAVAPGRSRGVLLAVVAALAAVRVLLSPRLQAGYRRSLADSLRAGKMALSGVGVLDSGTVGALSRASSALGRAALLDAVAQLRAERASAPTADGAGARVSLSAFDLPVCPEVEATGPPGAAEPPAPAADAVLVAAANLRSGDAGRALDVLAKRRTEPALVPHVLALLADDRLARDAADWLTAQEPPPIGQLGDALLSDRLPDGARRRVARLLGKSDDPRAADALIVALAAVPTGVRPGVAHALARAAARRPLPREPILAAVRRAALEGPRGDVAAHLDEIFRLLAAAYPREPIQPALGALVHGGDARGTALEWLDVLLPSDVKLALWPRLVRSGERVVATPRGADELRKVLWAAQGGAAPSGERDGEG